VDNEILDHIGIATNKQVIPDDPRPPLRPSGIRIGTPACTTRGMSEQDMNRVASWIVEALKNSNDLSHIAHLSAEVKAYCAGFPIPGFDSLPW